MIVEALEGGLGVLQTIQVDWIDERLEICHQNLRVIRGEEWTSSMNGVPALSSYMNLREKDFRSLTEARCERAMD